MAAHLAVQCELVVRKETVGFIKEEVSSDELLESPVLPLHKAICPLTLCNAGATSKEEKKSDNTYVHTHGHTHTWTHAHMDTRTHTHTHTPRKHTRARVCAHRSMRQQNTYSESPFLLT